MWDEGHVVRGHQRVDLDHLAEAARLDRLELIRVEHIRIEAGHASGSWPTLCG